MKLAKSVKQMLSVVSQARILYLITDKSYREDTRFVGTFIPFFGEFMSHFYLLSI